MFTQQDLDEAYAKGRKKGRESIENMIIEVWDNKASLLALAGTISGLVAAIKAERTKANG